MLRLALTLVHRRHHHTSVVLRMTIRATSDVNHIQSGRIFGGHLPERWRQGRGSGEGDGISCVVVNRLLVANPVVPAARFHTDSVRLDIGKEQQRHMEHRKHGTGLVSG